MDTSQLFFSLETNVIKLLMISAGLESRPLHITQACRILNVCEFKRTGYEINARYLLALSCNVLIIRSLVLRPVYTIKVSVIEVSVQTLCWTNIKATAVFERYLHNHIPESKYTLITETVIV